MRQIIIDVPDNISTDLEELAKEFMQAMMDKLSEAQDKHNYKDDWKHTKYKDLMFYHNSASLQHKVVNAANYSMFRYYKMKKGT